MCNKSACYAALCDLAQFVFKSPERPGPCPALISAIGGGYACGLVVQPSRFVPQATVAYGEQIVRQAEQRLINSGQGCDMRINGETNEEYSRRMDELDRANAAGIAAARRVWGIE